MKVQQIRLCEVADIITGIATSKSDEGQYRYYYYQPNSFTESGEVIELSTVIRKEPVNQRQLIRVGDVLVKRLNPNYPLLISVMSGESIVSTNLFIIRGKSEIIPEYLAFLFEQTSVMAQISQISGGSSAIRAISAKKLMDITIPILPIEKQNLVGEWWKLVKKRKQLLSEYMSETNRLTTAITEKILI